MHPKTKCIVEMVNKDRKKFYPMELVELVKDDETADEQPPLKICLSPYENKSTQTNGGWYDCFNY